MIRVKRLLPEAKIPTRAHEDDAGLDLYTAEAGILQPGERKLFSTGIAVEIPFGWAALYWDRSSMATKKGCKVMGGVIDAGYRGEHKVCLVNLSNEPVEIVVGDRIAQMILQPVYTGGIEEVDELSETSRGAGGWGSTGR